MANNPLEMGNILTAKASGYIFNEDNYIKLRIENYVVEGIINIDSISCDDNVQTSQPVGSSRTLSERGSRSPYSFSLNITFLVTEKKTVDEQIEEIIKLREMKKPLSIMLIKIEKGTNWSRTMNKLEKYGIKKMNILDYTAEEHESYSEVSLSCEEVIEYDVDVLELTPEQSFSNSFTPSPNIKSKWKEVFNGLIP